MASLRPSSSKLLPRSQCSATRPKCGLYETNHSGECGAPKPKNCDENSSTWLDETGEIRKDRERSSSSMATFIIGDRVFKTKAQAEEEIRRVRQRVKDSGRAAGADDEFLRDLLALHPDAAEKAGAGVLYFDVRTNFGATEGFWITRQDGSQTDFSFKKCLRAATNEDKVRNAMRVAVRPQIEAFRSAAYAGKDTVTCAVSGDEVRMADCHVDHDSPTFIEIADQFAALEGGYQSIAVTAGDGVIGHRFSSSTIEARWVDHHEKFARLRVVSKRSNLSTLRRGIRRRR